MRREVNHLSADREGVSESDRPVTARAREEAGTATRFGLVGLAATGVHLGVAALLLFLWPQLNEFVANIIAFCVAFQVSLVGHRRLTFKRQGSAWRFGLVAAGGFALRVEASGRRSRLPPGAEENFAFAVRVLVMAAHLDPDDDGGADAGADAGTAPRQEDGGGGGGDAGAAARRVAHGTARTPARASARRLTAACPPACPSPCLASAALPTAGNGRLL